MKINNIFLLLVIGLLIINSSSVNSELALTWCKGLSYGNACFNGTSGQTMLTGVKVNWSNIVTPNMTFSNYDFGDNNFNGTGNFTTTGIVTASNLFGTLNWSWISNVPTNYYLLDGTRTLTGNMNANTFNISTTGTLKLNGTSTNQPGNINFNGTCTIIKGTTTTWNVC